MDATWSEEGEKMQPPATRCRTCGGERLVRSEAPIGDRRVDAREVLWHPLPSADVQVTDLAVPHLPLWKSNGGTARREARVRPSLE
jgi:hypothetical protein